MESSTGNSQCLTTSANNTNSSSTISITSPPSTNTSSTTASTTTTTIAASSTVIASSSSTAAASISSTSNLTATGNLTSVTSAPTAAAVVHPHAHHHQPYHTPLLQILPFDIGKQDDSNNLSLASGLSEGQRSLSAAPSASSSPILSPPGKIFGRNANGTMVATSRPSNEAEIQLYRVLQKASLLAYYDTLLEMGGDDVQQLYEAGEEEFLEIMALVGMASKPLHVRRLQKALHEWALNPTQFQQSLANNSAQFETPAKSSPVLYNIEPSTSHMVARPKFQTFTTTTPTFNPTPLTNTAPPSTSAHILSQICSLPPMPAHKTPSYILPSNLATHDRPHTLPSNPSLTNPLNTAHQVTSSSPQLTPVLSEMQVARITMGAEKIASQLPQREPRAHTLKKRTNRELEQVIAMSENDPRRMDEIRKYSAIYGRFDCKRRPEKPLTLHEVCVNEAAAQLCRLVPALLTRRDELFPLARQIVKDAGFGHSATIARYGNLLSQMSAGQTSSPQARSVSSAVDCESSESNLTPLKRQRLSSSEASLTASDSNRDSLEDPRYNLFAMYQKFAAKPPFDLTDIAKFTLNKQSSEFEDQDQESRFSFSNSSSPSIPNTGPEEEDRNAAALLDKSFMKSDYTNNNSLDLSPSSNNHSLTEAGTPAKNLPLSGDVQVISAAGNHIIAVANPALVMSPTLNETISLKRETNSPNL